MRLEINGSPVFVGTGSTPLNLIARPSCFCTVRNGSLGVADAGSIFRSPRFNVVAPDFPQHGQSQGDALERGSDGGMGGDLAGSLELSTVACVGHSMGS